MLRRHEQEALEGINWFRRRDRASARRRAAESARAELAAADATAYQQQKQHQAELDRLWTALCANDPDVVMATLAHAFEDNEAPAAPLGVNGDEVSLVVLVPNESVVPDRMPGTTPAGNVSLPKTSKAQRDSFYLAAVCGYVLVTVRETLAVAPGVKSTRVIALRHLGLDSYGKPRIECLLAGCWRREGLDGVEWDRAEATDVLRDTPSELLVNLRAGRQLQPIDLDREGDIAALVAVVDVDDLVHPS